MKLKVIDDLGQPVVGVSLKFREVDASNITHLFNLETDGDGSALLPPRTNPYMSISGEPIWRNNGYLNDNVIFSIPANRNPYIHVIERSYLIEGKVKQTDQSDDFSYTVSLVQADDSIDIFRLLKTSKDFTSPNFALRMQDRVEKIRVEIEAPGYAMWQSEIMETEGHKFPFIRADLKPLQHTKLLITDHAGKPVTDAKVLKSRDHFKLGSFPEPLFKEADRSGTIQYDSSQIADDEFITVVSISGIANFYGIDFKKLKTLSLSQWSELELNVNLKAEEIRLKFDFVRFRQDLSSMKIFTDLVSDDGPILGNIEPGPHVLRSKLPPGLGVAMLEIHRLDLPTLTRTVPVELIAGERKSIELNLPDTRIIGTLELPNFLKLTGNKDRFDHVSIFEKEHWDTPWKRMVYDTSTNEGKFVFYGVDPGEYIFVGYIFGESGTLPWMTKPQEFILKDGVLDLGTIEVEPHK